MLDTIRFYGSLYRDFVAQFWKTRMASKLDFFFGLGAFLATQAGGILLLVFVFQSIPSLNGWSLAQVLFIYGFAQLPRGLDHVFTDYFWLFAEHSIIEGEYDRYLLRPASPLFQVIAEDFQVDGLGELIVGVAMIAISSVQLGLRVTAPGAVAFVALVLGGAIIYSSIKLLFASLAFWLKDSFPLLQIAYNFADFAKYPDGIFPRPVSWFLTFVLPFAFTAFIPAAWFLGKISWAWAIGGTLGAAIATATIAGLTWTAGQKRYDSAGN